MDPMKASDHEKEFQLATAESHVQEKKEVTLAISKAKAAFRMRSEHLGLEHC